MRPRAVLICHHDAPLHREGVARWLASWSELRGILVIEEPSSRLVKRLRRERRRVGLVRLLDVLAMRLYYRIRCARADGAWEQERLERFLAEKVRGGAGLPGVYPPNEQTLAEYRDWPGK